MLLLPLLLPLLLLPLLLVLPPLLPPWRYREEEDESKGRAASRWSSTGHTTATVPEPFPAAFACVVTTPTSDSVSGICRRRPFGWPGGPGSGLVPGLGFAAVGSYDGACNGTDEGVVLGESEGTAVDLGPIDGEQEGVQEGA